MSLLAKDDISFYLIESDLQSLPSIEESNFSRLIFLVLRIAYRDLASFSKRQSRLEDASKIQGKLLTLQIQDDSTKSTEIFENWLQVAEEHDLQYVLTFLNFLQESNQQTEKFLPPLSSVSKERWKAHLLSGVTMSSKFMGKNLDGPDMGWIWEGSEKMKIEPKDFLKLKFLSDNFSNISLPDAGLIQISLKVKVEDLCEKNGETISSRFDEFLPDVSEPKLEPTQSILESIRGSIKRLSELEKNSYTSRSEPARKTQLISKATLRKFDSIMEKFNHHLIEDEITKEMEFIKSIPDLENESILGRFGSLDLREGYPMTSTPKTYPLSGLEGGNKPSTSDTYEPYYQISGPSTFFGNRQEQENAFSRLDRPYRSLQPYERSRSQFFDVPSTSKADPSDLRHVRTSREALLPEEEFELNLREELSDIGSKLSEIRQYLDHTTRNLKIPELERDSKTMGGHQSNEKETKRQDASSASKIEPKSCEEQALDRPQPVRKSLARQRRSARSSLSSGASSSSGLSSASSMVSSSALSSPMGSIFENEHGQPGKGVELRHKPSQKSEKHDQMSRFRPKEHEKSQSEGHSRKSGSSKASRRSKSRSKSKDKSEKSISRSEKSHKSQKSTQKKAEPSLSEEDSSRPSSFSRSPPRSRHDSRRSQKEPSSRRSQNFLQDLEPLPVPSLPRIERLDFGQLSPDPKDRLEKEEMKWKELSLYESDVSKRDSAYGETERSMEKGYSEWMMKGKAYEKFQEFVFPDWLKLLPPSEKDCKTSKLLELRIEPSKQDFSSNPSQNKPQFRSKLSKTLSYDNETSSPPQKVHFVADMTDEQIQDLLNLCKT